MRAPLDLDDVPAVGVCLESVAAIDSRAYWLSGWIHGPPAEARLTFVTPDGRAVRPAPGTVSFHPRRDVDTADKQTGVARSCGFYAYVELDKPPREAQGWAVRSVSPDGGETESVAGAPSAANPATIRARAMHVMRLPVVPDRVIEGQVLPALTRLQAAEAVSVAACFEFGAVPSAPEFSLVVPLRTIDRVDHQLLQFAPEPDIAHVEVIYVIPPGLGAACRARGQALAELFGVPFRVVELTEAAPRARAFNLGAELATGHTLIFMHGDVFPTITGWLGGLNDFLRSNRAIGAVAPRLLFIDGSIAHAGTEYAMDKEAGTWEREIPWQGLSAALPVTRGARRVRALSDAFLMMALESFSRCGGFTEEYLPGADDGGDLCLKLADIGLESWIAPIDMYLLERASSWPCQRGPAIDRVNDWIFARRWGAMLGGDARRGGGDRSARLRIVGGGCRLAAGQAYRSQTSRGSSLSVMAARWSTSGCFARALRPRRCRRMPLPTPSRSRAGQSDATVSRCAYRCGTTDAFCRRPSRRSRPMTSPGCIPGCWEPTGRGFRPRSELSASRASLRSRSPRSIQADSAAGSDTCRAADRRCVPGPQAPYSRR